MKISIIAAMAKNRVIGKDNSIPWHISEDFRYFKKMTLNKPIVMGRKTFESLPGILPKRAHLIVSRDTDYKTVEEKCTVYNSLPRVLNRLRNTTINADINPENEAFIIGGAQIYQLALDLRLVDKIYLTYINQEFDGDTFFPEIDQTRFALVSEKEGEESIGSLRYYFRVYEKI
jgi:dihydrofolate reductase